MADLYDTTQGKMLARSKVAGHDYAIVVFCSHFHLNLMQYGYDARLLLLHSKQMECLKGCSSTFTESKTGRPKCFVPPFVGVTPPTICVP